MNQFGDVVVDEDVDVVATYKTRVQHEMYVPDDNPLRPRHRLAALPWRPKSLISCGVSQRTEAVSSQRRNAL